VSATETLGKQDVVWLAQNLVARPAEDPPLLSNLYMRRLCWDGSDWGEQQFGGRIVTYADDLVICCKRRAEEALASMRQIMKRLRLTVNEEKTHICHVPKHWWRISTVCFEAGPTTSSWVG
jgi:hypothetical protein